MWCLAKARRGILTMGKNIKPYNKRGKSFKVVKERCAECGTTKNLTIHHKKKKCDGGINHPRNYEILCRDCHDKAHHYKQLDWLCRKLNKEKEIEI
jgi:5-methylcytosine-specific restriction endonuclease McrA